MYEDQMDPAFPGMKVDLRDDLVESFPVGADLPFGLVCGLYADGLLGPGGGTIRICGISLHTHTVPYGVDRYVETDCASVIRRGMVWARATPGGTVTVNYPVSFNADGTVSDGGALRLANAVFRTPKITLRNGTQVARVELHNPFTA